MKINKYESREEWLAARRGKITGSRAKDIISRTGIPKESIVQELEALKIEFKKSAKKNELQALLPLESLVKLKKQQKKKIGFYELIAERLGIPADDESPMDRGTRLESEAIAMLEAESGKKFDQSLVIWSRDENENIAISPDGFVASKKKITEAVEAKCLASSRHIEAFLTQQIPDDYQEQKIQYFVVNDDLKLLNFAFFDPRLIAKPFFVIKVTREEIQDEIDEYLEYEKDILKEVDEAVNNLTF